MEEKITHNKNFEISNNQKTKNRYTYNPRKKNISQNQIFTPKNTDKPNAFYLKKNTKNFQNNDIYKKNKSNVISGNESAKLKEKKEDKIEIENKKELSDNKNKEKISTHSSAFKEKCITNEEEEELVTSFERKPSEIHSPKTISEDSFITEISKIKNIANNETEIENEDIVNYDKEEEFQNNLNKDKKKNEEKSKFINSKRFLKDTVKKETIFLNYNIKACKEMKPDNLIENKLEKLSKGIWNKNNKWDKNKNQSNNIELNKKEALFISRIDDKESKPKITNINIYYNQDLDSKKEVERDKSKEKEKYKYGINYLNSEINTNKRKVKFELEFDSKNNVLNNSNIYIPVNQRRKLNSSRKKINFESEYDSIIEMNNLKKNLNNKELLFNSTEFEICPKLITKTFKLSKIIQNKDQKNSPNDSIKNISNDLTYDENDFENKEGTIPHNMKNKSSMKYNKNIIKKNYLKKSIDLGDKKPYFNSNLDKFSITNINFYKNNNIKNLNKNNNKLFLSIDELNGYQNTRKSCDISRNGYKKNSIIYAPKKSNFVKSRSKKKNDVLYNRASYDPSKSNYNIIRRKKFFNQNIISSLDTMNNNNNNKHTRNYSGINNSCIDMEKKSMEYIPNKLNILNNNNFNIFNNNSLCMNKNTIKMKLIDNMNRSYEGNYYTNFTNLNNNNEINDKEFNFQLKNKSKNKVRNNMNNFLNKTPNKSILNHNNFINNFFEGNERKKFNIYTNNANNNANSQISFDNPILKYNIRTNVDYPSSTINIVNQNNNREFIIKEKPAFFPEQHNLNLDIRNSYNRLNNINLHAYQNQSNLINLLNNNQYDLNKNRNLGQNMNNSDSNYNLGFNLNLFNYLNNQQKINNLSMTLKLEDLLLLLEKFNNIIISFNDNNNGRIVFNECFEFLNYYYNCSAYCQLEKLFLNNIDSNIVKISLNYCLMSVIILYDYSFEINVLKNDFVILNNIFKLNYMNLMLISEHTLKMVISSKVQLNNQNNLYNNFLILKLYNIIDIFRNKGGFENDFIEFKSPLTVNDLDMSNVEKISYNTNLITQYIRYVLKNNKTSRNDLLTSFFKKIKEKTYEEINIFFREYIFRIINQNGSILASVFLKYKQINNLSNNNLFNKNHFRTFPAPYLRTKNNKKYSLVLDLDETLVNFKQGKNIQEGVVRIRPGVNEFLEEVGEYYELIIFTTATQEYADLLIDAIEEDKIYFDHRLYREHATIIDNDFVKDLTRIGRPLDKIIIIDNMPQNFKLQKENGIIIRPFWGEDSYDQALFKLIPILVNIAKEGGDVRRGLAKYRDEIFKNITSVLYV